MLNDVKGSWIKSHPHTHVCTHTNSNYCPCHMMSYMYVPCAQCAVRMVMSGRKRFMSQWDNCVPPAGQSAQQQGRKRTRRVFFWASRQEKPSGFLLKSPDISFWLDTDMLWHALGTFPKFWEICQFIYGSINNWYDDIAALNTQI